jgi:hypothetical protein
MRALTHGQAGGQADPGRFLVRADQLLPGKEDGRHVCGSSHTTIKSEGAQTAGP